MTHTPAPWEFCDRTKCIVYEQEWSNGKQFLISSHAVLTKGETIEPIGEDEREQHKANAHLIAAAPELLEALKHCYEVFNMDDVDTALSLKCGMAIAKAEGKQ